MKLDLPVLLKLALKVAIMCGARDLVAGILRKHAADLRKKVRGTASKNDDLLGEAAANAMDLAASVALGADLSGLNKLIR